MDMSVPTSLIIERRLSMFIVHCNMQNYSANAEHEILCHAGNHWGTGIVSKSLKIIWTTFKRFSTKNRHARKITRHKQSATI
jgi:hypothetical protein